jgi:hypothetical protein
MGLLKLVVNILSLFAMVSEPVMAAQAKANYNKSFNEFLKLTEVHKRQVTLREFYQKTEKYLPTEIRKQVLALVNEQGDKLMPKIQVSKVNYRGKQTPAISFVEGKTSGVVTLLDGYHTGQNNEVFKFGDDVYSVTDFDSLPTLARDLEYNANTSLKKERMPSSVTESFPDISKVWGKLNQQQRYEMLKKLQEILKISVQIQESITQPTKQKNQNNSTSQNFIELAIQKANALGIVIKGDQITRGTPCIAKGGWPGMWTFESVAKAAQRDVDPKNLICVPSFSKGSYSEKYYKHCRTDNTTCNPFIYGLDNEKKPRCIPAADPISTLDSCGKYLTPENMVLRGSTVTEFNNHLTNVSNNISWTDRTCERYIVTNRTKTLIDSMNREAGRTPQKDLCDKLQSRTRELKSLYCKDARVNTDKLFKDFCSTSTPPTAAAAAAAAPGSADTTTSTTLKVNPGLPEGEAAAGTDRGGSQGGDQGGEAQGNGSTGGTDGSQGGGNESAEPVTEGEAQTPPRGAVQPPEFCPIPANNVSCDEWEKNPCLRKNGYMVGYHSKDFRLNSAPQKSVDKICKASGWFNDYPKATAIPDTNCWPPKDQQSSRVIQKCECESNSYELIYDRGSESYSCVKNSRESNDSSYGSSSRDKGSWFSKNKGWLFPMFAILLAGLVGYLAFSSQKKQIEKAADPFFVANPPTNGLIPLPPPRTGTGIRN